MNPLKRSRVVATVAVALALSTLASSARAELLRRSDLFDPTTMARARELRPGMRGVGKTVFQGTQIEDFDVTVLAVLEAVDFGGDLILVRIESGPCVDKGYGVIGGMSGSPVYVGGKLIGAVAYAWPFAKVPIAGVQPIEQMLECIHPRRTGVPPPELALRPRSGPVSLEGRMYDQVIVQRRPHREEPGPGLGAPAPAFRILNPAVRPPHSAILTPVATPLMVTGMQPRARARLGRLLAPHGIVPVAGPGRATNAAAIEPEPGAAIGVQLVRGDWELTAVGTLTCLVGDTVLAFGHPFVGSGAVDLPLVGATVHAIMSGADMSFKFSSSLAPLGAIKQDRPWAVGGTLGATPDLLPAQIAVSDLDREVRREYKIEVARHRSFAPVLSSVAAENALDLLVSPEAQRTTYVDFEAEVEGLPTLRRSNVFSSMPGGGGSRSMLSLLSFFGGGPTDAVAQLLSLAQENRFGERRIEKVRVSLAASETRKAAEIKRVAADKTVVKPGETVNLTVTLETAKGEERTLDLPVELPENLPTRAVRVALCGGQSFRSIQLRYGLGEAPPASFEQLVGLWQKVRTNNQLIAALSLPTVGLVVEGHRLPTLPVSVLEVLRKACPGEVGFARDGLEASTATEWDVKGRRYLTLQVESEEREKAGRAYVSSRYGSSYGYDGDDDDDNYESPRRDTATGNGIESDDAVRRPAWARSCYELAGTVIEFPEGKVDVDTPPKMPTLDELEESEANLPEPAGGHRTLRSESGLARGPLVWVTDSERDFSRGKARTTQISTTGLVRPALVSTALPKIEDSCYWTATTNDRGDLFVGTWTEGTVWRFPPAGEPAVVLNTGEPAITCLIQGANGVVWAAAAPSGRVFRIVGAEAKEFARVPEPYVWALCERPDGSLLAATGPDGKLFRVGPEGEAELLWTFPDRHVIALAQSKAGAFCATSPKGKVYRIGDDGKPSSFFETPRATVLSLAADDLGNVFVGTSPRAAVYRIDPHAQAKELYRSRSKHVFALAADGEGGAYAALGSRGEIVHLTAEAHRWRMTDSPSPDYLALVKSGPQLLATTVGAGIRRLHVAPNERNVYDSEVRDVGTKARWGKLRWYAETPGESRIVLQTRTGNTAFPDGAWSPWSQMYPNDFGQQIESPSARYIQFRALFIPDPAAGLPTLDRVELYALTQNRPPTVEIKSPHAGEVLSGKARIRWSASDPDRDKLRFTVAFRREGEKEWTEIKSADKSKPAETDLDLPPPDEKEQEPAEEPAAEQEPDDAEPAEPAPEREREAIQDRADDDDEPEGKPGELDDEPAEFDEEPDAKETEDREDNDWSSAATSGSAQSRQWGTAELPEGAYRVKVSVTDEERNPGEGKSAEAVSAVFLIDNTAPSLELPELGERRPTELLAATASDEWCRVASAEYRVDDGDWTAAACEDCVFDSRREAIEIDPTKLPGGKHKLTLRARDAAGNVATREIEYEWPEEQARGIRSVVDALTRCVRARLDRASGRAA